MRNAIASRLRDGIGLVGVLVLLASCGGGGGGGGRGQQNPNQPFASDRNKQALESLIAETKKA